MPPVLSDVDYDARGKQVSVLRVPYTRDSAGLDSVRGDGLGTVASAYPA